MSTTLAVITSISMLRPSHSSGWQHKEVLKLPWYVIQKQSTDSPTSAITCAPLLSGLVSIFYRRCRLFHEATSLLIDRDARNSLLEFFDRLRCYLGTNQVDGLEALQVLERIKTRVRYLGPAQC